MMSGCVGYLGTCYRSEYLHIRLITLFCSPLGLDEAGSETSKIELDEQFRHARSELLETLREHRFLSSDTLVFTTNEGRDGFAPQAFQLAETYRDFRNLVSLCHKDTIFPPQENPNADRIDAYIEKFKDDFTTELYRWYIEHGTPIDF